jgi:hypothetical protein
MDWSGTKNGKLLVLASPSFEALITVDMNLEHQQNLAKQPLAVVLISAKRTKRKTPGTEAACVVG